VFEDELI